MVRGTQRVRVPGSGMEAFGSRWKKMSFHRFWSRTTSLTQASGVHVLPEGRASGSWKGARRRLGLQ